jgi:hypothetical protein
MKGTMEEFVEKGAGGSGFGRQVIGSLDLTQDLRLALNHRIEAGGNPEDMSYSFLFAEAVEVPFEFIQGEAMVAAKKVLQLRIGLPLFMGSCIDLYSIAGGEYHGLFHGGQRSGLPERILQIVLLKGQSLPDLEGGSLVIQADDYKFHSIAGDLFA